MDQIRVLIVEDGRIDRMYMQELLNQQTDIDVIGVAVNGTEALAMHSVLNPDVVLLDINLPDMNGFVVLRKLIAQNAATKIIMVTQRNDIPSIVQAIEDGARGYILKDRDVREIGAYIKIVVKSNILMLPQDLRESVRAAGWVIPANEAQPNTLNGLTVRELHVIRLLKTDHTNDQIAEAIAVSPRQTKRIITAIVKRMSLRNRRELKKYIPKPPSM